jgi:hypothetical protein
LDHYENGDCIDFWYGYCWEYEKVPVYRTETEQYDAVIGRKLISPRRVQIVPFTSKVNFTIDIAAAKTKSGFTVKKQ